MLNRLRGSRAYLCGAIDRVSDEQSEGWRNEMAAYLHTKNVTVLNPCDKPIDIGIEDKESRKRIAYLKETEQYHLIRPEHGVIRNVDLRMCDVSDFIIVAVNIDAHLCGSYEEVFLSNRQRKPVLVWCYQGKKHAPNWLFFTLPHQHIFGSLDSLKDYIHHVDTSEEVKHHRRWFFFDFWHEGIHA